MDENNKQLPKINATVKKHSIAKELLDYAIKEEIEPKSKELLHNMIAGTLNMFNDAARKALDKQFYPDGNVPRRTVKSNSSVGDYIPHTRYNTTVISRSDGRVKESINTRSSVSINDIWVDTPEKADSLLATLIELIDNYGKAKVADLYEQLTDENGNKIATTFTDFRFGWTKEDIPAMSYYNDRGKWYIDLPKPTNIENV